MIKLSNFDSLVKPMKGGAGRRLGQHFTCKT